MGRRTTNRVEVAADGPARGALCAYRPSTDGGDFDLQLLPQVGFGKDEQGPFEYFLLTNLPTKEELLAKGYERGSMLFIRVWGATLTEAQGHLVAAGFDLKGSTAQVPPPSGRTRIEYAFRISHPEFRAISKIAFNYLAYVAGPHIALMPHFNDVRRYVRHNVSTPQSLVEIISPLDLARSPTGASIPFHLITVERRGDLIVAQVSLLGRFRYLVTLSSTPFVIEMSLSSGRAFDVEKRQIVPVDPPGTGRSRSLQSSR